MFDILQKILLVERYTTSIRFTERWKHSFYVIVTLGREAMIYRGKTRSKRNIIIFFYFFFFISTTYIYSATALNNVTWYNVFVEIEKKYEKIKKYASNITILYYIVSCRCLYALYVSYYVLRFRVENKTARACRIKYALPVLRIQNAPHIHCSVPSINILNKIVVLFAFAQVNAMNEKKSMSLVFLLFAAICVCASGPENNCTTR